MNGKTTVLLLLLTGVGWRARSSSLPAWAGMPWCEQCLLHFSSKDEFAFHRRVTHNDARFPVGSFCLCCTRHESSLPDSSRDPNDRWGMSALQNHAEQCDGDEWCDACNEGFGMLVVDLARHSRLFHGEHADDGMQMVSARG
jgi:hypothetical protein